MKVTAGGLNSVLVLEPRVFRDGRGHFFESWSRDRYAEASIEEEFVQDNISFSRRGVLRGLHFQNPDPQAKLVSVPQGTIWDVAVDLRMDSATFGRWTGWELSAENGKQLYVPVGFAHGFVVISDTALVSYKCSNSYSPQHERALRWDDPELGIAWPTSDPILSRKDAEAPLLREMSELHLFSGAAIAAGSKDHAAAAMETIQ